MTATHTLCHHAHYHTRGEGHLYQARFKSFPVQSDEHFYIVCRYVERNPVRAKLVDSAKLWRFGSLFRWNQASEPAPVVFSAWPIRRLPSWNRRVDAAFSAKELAEVWTCVERGRPFGDQTWVENVADRHSLWHTARPRPVPEKHKPQNDS